MNRNHPRTLALLLGAITLSAPVFAVPLAPGATVAINGTTLASRPELAGTAIYDVTTPFLCTRADGTTLAKGKVESRVVQDSGGYYDFYYRLFVDTDSPGYIFDFIVSNYGSTLYTDVDWRIDGVGDVAPYKSFRDNAPGTGVYFSFYAPGVHNGTSSRFIFVQTRTSGYRTGGNVALHVTDNTTYQYCNVAAAQPM